MLLRDCWKDEWHLDICCLWMNTALIPWQIFDTPCICCKARLMFFHVLELPKPRIDTSLSRSTLLLCIRAEDLLQFFLCISSGATSQLLQSAGRSALLLNIYSAGPAGSAGAVMRLFMQTVFELKMNSGNMLVVVSSWMTESSCSSNNSSSSRRRRRSCSSSSCSSCSSRSVVVVVVVNTCKHPYVHLGGS